jgi:glycosyltransferase involved in cell wall biosynthesis
LSRLSFVRAIPAFRRLHRSLCPDVTLGYYASSYGILAALAPRPRVVITAGSDVLRDGQESLLQRALVPRLAGFALRRADLILCWASHLERAAVDLGAPPSHVLTLPRGVDVVRFHPADASETGPPRIISTRALAPFYRPEIVLDAFLELRDRGVPALLDMVGDGPSRDALVARATASRHAADVTFPGRIDPDTLGTRLRSSSVYASFPPSDGVSASLLEAMASGLLPVVTDLDANRAWVDNEINGLLVPEPITVKAACEALGLALGDGELRRRARTQNAAVVRERGDRDRNTVRFEEAFSSLVSRVSAGA